MIENIGAALTLFFMFVVVIRVDHHTNDKELFDPFDEAKLRAGVVRVRAIHVADPVDPK